MSVDILLYVIVCDLFDRFKEEEKERKLAQKRAKAEAIRLKFEEEERVSCLTWLNYKLSLSENTKESNECTV